MQVSSFVRKRDAMIIYYDWIFARRLIIVVNGDETQSGRICDKLSYMDKMLKPSILFNAGCRFLKSGLFPPAKIRNRVAHSNKPVFRRKDYIV